ncbi:hypothetical protein BR93DRAFT_471157 [Coniochaeta sp. PMI_546]|nr:hypothetical protein BR93DRAFT_471157 [Coniochaeta sp. PMI_546]
MRLPQVLSLVALPLAAAMPAATPHDVHEAGAHIQRAVLMNGSQFNFDPFNLTNIGMECARPTADDMYACELRFDWHDPNSVKENNVTSCSCIYKWSWDGETVAAGEKNTYSASYSMCYKQLPVYFEMRIAAFNSSEDFALEVAHRYHDSENFTAPWDYPLTFAQPDIHLPLITREDNFFRLYDAGPVYANITAVSD